MQRPRRLVAALVAVAAVFAVGGLLLPSSTHLERSITIQRTPADIRAVLDSRRRFNQSLAWFELDPRARHKYAGSHAGFGAHLNWAGDPLGSGTQRITESMSDRKATYRLDIDGGRAISTFTLEPDEAGTRVTWRFDSRHGGNLAARWLGPLMDYRVGTTYEKGLARLKARLEAESH